MSVPELVNILHNNANNRQYKKISISFLNLIQNTTTNISGQVAIKIKIIEASFSKISWLKSLSSIRIPTYASQTKKGDIKHNSHFQRRLSIRCSGNVLR